MRKDMDEKKMQQLLLERKQELEASIAAQHQDNSPKELDQARIGRLSRMDALQQQAMGKAAENLARIELQRIQTALERLDEGEYGFCILCEEEIALKRLLFDPSLLTCIECARQAESKKQ